jgi:hypothetical protein
MAVDLIVVMRAAQSLSSFLDGPMFLDAVADVGMHASRASLARAASARDRRAQVWSAVNHLEEADAAIRLILQRWRGSIRYTAPTRAEDLMQKRSYILCLLAACYKYLGEDKLTEQALDEAEAAVSNYPSFQHPLNL